MCIVFLCSAEMECCLGRACKILTIICRDFLLLSFRVVYFAQINSQGMARLHYSVSFTGCVLQCGVGSAVVCSNANNFLLNMLNKRFIPCRNSGICRNYSGGIPSFFSSAEIRRKRNYSGPKILIVPKFKICRNYSGGIPLFFSSAEI